MTLAIKRFLKQTLALTLAASVIAFLSFAMAEPATTSAQDSSTFDANLTVDEEIALTVGTTPISMDPNIGLSNDYSDGKTNLNVETSSKNGYTLTLQASSSPALTHDSTSDSFEDYTPATTDTAESWSTDSNSYQFGYSAFGDDVASDFTSGGNCTDGDPTSGTEKYEETNTTAETIASNSTSTDSSGVDTTLCVAAAQNGVNAPSGNYTATLTATATVN